MSGAESSRAGPVGGLAPRRARSRAREHNCFPGHTLWNMSGESEHRVATTLSISPAPEPDTSPREYIGCRIRSPLPSGRLSDGRERQRRRHGESHIGRLRQYSVLHELYMVPMEGNVDQCIHEIDDHLSPEGENASAGVSPWSPLCQSCRLYST